MSSKERWYTGGAVVIGAIVLYLLLHKVGAVAPGWQINIPALQPATIPPPQETVFNFPLTQNNNPSPCQPTCGCSSGGLFASISDMIASFTGQEAAIEDSYFAGIIASLPPWFAQNLNNVEGAYTSGASINAFNSF